tara:strand:- start:152 stop:679 length:528 start_codon:yes stop_codon:yes gene_type:complete
MNIEELSNSININYIKNLIQQIKSNEDKYEPNIYSNKIINMEEIISNLKQSNNITSSETENRQIVNNSKSITDNVFHKENSESVSENNEFSDDYLYKKPWTKLSNIHKIIKIKEFVQKLIINKDEDREKLKESLVNLVNKKVLTKKDMVKYDALNARIIGIPNLKFSNGKYHIIL